MKKSHLCLNNGNSGIDKITTRDPPGLQVFPKVVKKTQGQQHSMLLYQSQSIFNRSFQIWLPKCPLTATGQTPKKVSYNHAPHIRILKTILAMQRKQRT